MNYWLMKNEPEAYSITDLERDGVGRWDGVRNYQVRNMMRDDMTVGDKAFFYHSNAGKATGIVGEMEVVSLAYPDPLQFNAKSTYYDPKSREKEPRWLCVDVKYKKTFSEPVLLPVLGTNKKLPKLRILQKGNRLSVVPLTKAQYEEIINMGS